MTTQRDLWLKELRETAIPESLEEWHFDNEEDAYRRSIGLQEFWTQVMIDMGVPEEEQDDLLDEI